MLLAMELVKMKQAASEAIISKALDATMEQLAPLAASITRRELCSSCPDMKCLTDSVCRTFLLSMQGCSWDILEEISRRN